MREEERNWLNVDLDLSRMKIKWMIACGVASVTPTYHRRENCRKVCADEIESSRSSFPRSY